MTIGTTARTRGRSRLSAGSSSTSSTSRWAAPAVLGTFVGALVLLQAGAGVAAPLGRAPARGTGTSLGALAAARFTSASTAGLGGLFPGGLAVADFTGDHRGDVAVAVASVQPVPGVQVAVGNGHGGFTGRVDTVLPGNADACDLATGDLNGDGLADLAATTCTSDGSTVVLLTGHGDGTFEVSQQIELGRALAHPAIGDLTGDGRADLAVVRETGGLSVYVGKGDGTVRRPTDYPGMSSDSVRAVDVTGDGKLDLSFTGPATMVNQGHGTFGAPVGPDFFALGSALVDLDGDGILDGAGVDASGAHVLIGHGTGDGRYHLVQTVSLPVTQTLSIAGGDFTGDGRGDLVVNGDGNIVYLLAGRGNGTVKAPVGYSTGPERLTAADIGGSPAADLLSVTSDPGTVYSALGGKGRLSAATLVPSSVPGEIALGDVDGDGRTDAVTGGGILPQDGGIESVLGAHLNRGKGRFAPTKVSKLRDELAGAGVAALELVDVNHDGNLDAVGGFENVQFQPDNVFVALGKGNGRFGTPLLTDTGDPRTDILDLAVTDVTGDGNLDVVANTNSAMSVLPGKGDGTFRAPILSGTAGPRQTNTLVDDVTGDGVADAVVTIMTGDEDVSSSDLVVERGDGGGHFTEVQQITVDTNIFGGVLADLDGDGRPDLAANGRGGTNGGRGGLYVLLDTAAGSLGSPTFYPNGGVSLVGADLNLDGSIDLATDGPIDTTAIGLNRGDGRFVFGTRVITPSGPAAAGDLSGDGAPDLVTHPSASPAAFGLTLNLTK